MNKYAEAITKGKELTEVLSSSFTEQLSADNNRSNPPAAGTIISAKTCNHKPLSLKTCQDDMLRTLGEQAAIIIHELRAPLATIRANIQLIQRQVRMDESMERRFGILYGEIERMNDLLSEYLCMAKQQEENNQEVDLRTLISQTATLMRSLFVTNGIELNEDYTEKLPPCYCSPRMLKHVLINLMINAVQACGCGNTVTIRLYAKETMQYIEVHDDGEGISSLNIEKIFQPFYTTKENGTGLGLPICIQAIEKMGGDISIYSIPHKDTAFIISLLEHKGAEQK